MSDTDLQRDWARRFAARMLELGIRAELREMVLLGEELYPIVGQLEPEAVALDEHADWPAEDRSEPAR